MIQFGGFMKKAAVFEYAKCISSDKQICKISCHKFSPGDRTRLHSHDFAELFWGVEGKGEHVLNDRKKNIGTGMLYLLRPGDEHAVIASNKCSYAFNNLMFPWWLIENMRDRYDSPILTEWCQNDLKKSLEIPLTPILQAQINLALSDVFMHLNERLPVEYFLIHLIYELEKQQNIVMLNAPSWLIQLCREIEKPQNFRQGNKIFVKLSGYSYEHVSRKIKEYLGMTPSELLNDVRLKYAAAQLVSSAEEINDIALDCGFQSLSYFYALFSKKFGITPRAYRIKNRFY